MTKNDTKVLLSTSDRIMAEQIQILLEASEIYTVLVSENPASSVMGAFLGSNPFETIHLEVSKSDYQKAIEILSDSPFKEHIGDK